MKRHKHQPRRSGFTLIEVLTVITILAILGGLGFGTYMLVIKRTKVTQTEVMLENISSNLEARISQGFSSDDQNVLSGRIDPSSLYPEGNGSASSTDNLYAVLSGDFDSDGKVDDDRQPMFPQIDPEYTGKGRYVNKDLLLVDAWLKPLRYEYSGTTNNNVENGFDLWSAGPDAIFDTEDDVKNW